MPLEHLGQVQEQILLWALQRLVDNSGGFVLEEGGITVRLVLDNFLNYLDDDCCEEIVLGEVGYGFGGWNGGTPEGCKSGRLGPVRPLWKMRIDGGRLTW